MLTKSVTILDIFTVQIYMTLTLTLEWASRLNLIIPICDRILNCNSKVDHICYNFRYINSRHMHHLGLLNWPRSNVHFLMQIPYIKSHLMAAVSWLRYHFRDMCSRMCLTLILHFKIGQGQM